MTIQNIAPADDAERLRISKVTEQLEQSGGHLLTGEQYKASLRDGRRIITSEGEEVEDVTTHPDLRAVDTLAGIQDDQFTAEGQDILTYVGEDGGRRAIGWQVPRTREDLLAKREATKFITQRTMGMYGRPNDYGAMMALGFLSTIDRIEAENAEFAENIRNFVKLSGDNNLLSTDLIADPQSDKNIPRNERPSQLRIVEDTPEGIVISGAKVAGSIGSLAHFFTLSTTLGGGVGPEAAIWAAIPMNSPGLSLILREPTAKMNTPRNDHPLDHAGEELDQTIIFDNVFIPREYVFSKYNLGLLDLYYESCAYSLWSVMTRLAFRAEMFAGVAEVITEILGTDKIPGVQAAVADVTMYAQTLKAYSLATIHESVEWCGLQVPNPDLTTAGRLYSIENYPRIMHILRDLCGQALIARWPEKVWDHPEFGPRMEAFFPGTGVSAREKNTFFNFVWDLTSGAHAGRVALFENVNATPPAFVRHLVYSKTDRSAAARRVRDYVGIS
ncbi:4-hydroxyphenylacetate 3-hydroxylase N-terminal domain-containing protein [Citricoccus sp. I39-566]|uniref:4-hydroxyphenylacetate 3-hydroxylase N-terminal domain-containing protein n=1 Tax=Citricoccus sp. I39-566 TaxID=3073268 RepID=UPI00286A5EC8|nr:4-hydroxyphenylacetate 3-hydroxylase N-terminal domain-containing protein [Citricoccus sp. I39-566]WMY78752.1 4-hydroxyphenylacetate 3-hydroxylase N-terminal domain-containing protein [Citricoccus sp. I39-566]